MAIRARWKGAEGEFVYGVPARNLSEDEYAALTPEQRAEVRASGVYDVKTEAEMAGEPKAEAPKAEPTAPASAPKSNAAGAAGKGGT
jgi:hypothetical protein